MNTTTRSRDDGRTDLTDKSTPADTDSEDALETPRQGEGETPSRAAGGGDEDRLDASDHYDNTETVGCHYCDWRGANNKLPMHLPECPGVGQ
jgi:hypothetical protein